MKKKIFLTGSIAIAFILIFAIVFNSCKKKAQAYTLETAKVVKGNVSNTVTATGTLQALKTVEVGTQVSGVINKLYADFNSHVTKGQLLAELDKTPLLAAMSNAQASLDDSKAELTYKTSNYNRVKALFDKNLIAQADYDEAFYLYSKAQASNKIALSNFEKAKINLDYASICSPIDGVVLSREVDEGQTVAASFNTPTLFSIANDLTQMQVEANIDEADIGLVKDKQRVEFTVDAYPNAKFNGEVTEIRLQSTISSNVVTYTVIVKAPNPDKKLMPGMTANITIFVEEANNVLLAPMKAIQFRPDSTALNSYMKNGPKPIGKPNMPAPPSQIGKNDSNFRKTEVWISRNNLIIPIQVETGVSDGVLIEIKSGLSEGEDVITSLNEAKGTSSEPTQSGSPFMPKPPKK